MRELTPEQFKQLLLVSYEDEVGGEAYFDRLADHHCEPAKQQKLRRLAALERQTAARLAPLLKRYGLEARPAEALRRGAREEADRDGALGWQGLIRSFRDDFPRYIQDFRDLERAGSHADADALAALTQHEIALIEFARRELENPEDSLAVIDAALDD